MGHARHDRGTDGHLAEDCVYHNIPLDPIVGTDAILAFVRGFADVTERITFHVISIASSGLTVLTERVDTFQFPDGKRVELPVMGRSRSVTTVSSGRGGTTSTSTSSSAN